MWYFISNPLGGQKSSIKNELILKYNDFYEITNGDYSSYGVIKKRKGLTKIGTADSDNPILGMHDFGTSANVHKLLKSNSNGTNQIIYYWNSPNWTDSGITGLTKAKMVRFANFLDLVFFVNGTEAVKDWNGAAGYDAKVAGAPIANRICVFGDRLYVTPTAYKSRVQYTTIPTALGVISWTTGDSGNYDVQTDDGDFITGIHPRRDRLLIFKNHYIESRDQYFRRVSMVRDIGTPEGDSIQTINNKTYFLNIDDDASSGIYEYFVSQPNKISLPIQDIIQQIDTTDSTKFISWKSSDNYNLQLPLLDSTIACVKYNTTHKIFSVDRYPITINSACQSVQSSIKSPYVGSSVGNVYRNFGVLDDTVPIKTKIKTHKINCNRPHLIKNFTRLAVFVNTPTKSTVYYRIDSRGEWKKAGLIEKQVSILSVNATGYNLEVFIDDDTNNVGFDLKGLAIEFIEEKEVRTQ